MKKMIIITATIALSISCNEKKNKSSVDDFIDSLQRAQKVDSMVKESMRNALFRDTVNLIDAPILIITAKPVTKAYSSYKDISLKYKNVSGKKISAIRFSWYGVNAFNEPADMGGLIEKGFGGGFSDTELNLNATETSEWGILSKDLKKVIKAWPTEVAFEDGTKWTASKN